WSKSIFSEVHAIQVVCSKLIIDRFSYTFRRPSHISSIHLPNHVAARSSIFTDMVFCSIIRSPGPPPSSTDRTAVMLHNIGCSFSFNPVVDMCVSCNYVYISEAVQCIDKFLRITKAIARRLVSTGQSRICMKLYMHRNHQWCILVGYRR